MWKLPCCLAIFNTVVETDIAVLPNQVLFMRLETSHIQSLPKAGKREVTGIHVEANVNSYLHLQAQDMKAHAYSM